MLRCQNELNQLMFNYEDDFPPLCHSKYVTYLVYLWIMYYMKHVITILFTFVFLYSTQHNTQCNNLTLFSRVNLKRKCVHLQACQVKRSR